MTDYTPSGEMVTIGQMPVYVARPPAKADCGVVMFTDMFGVNTGRHKQLCDQLARQGFLVACPDFFVEHPYLGSPPKFGVSVCCITEGICKYMCGRFDKNSRDHHAWDVSLRVKVMDTLLPWMRDQGTCEFASVGFCWGAYGAMKCAASPDFRCCTVFHPSVDGFCKATGEDDLKICKEVKCPILVVATSMEKDAWRPGGAAQRSCEEAVPGKVTWKFEEKQSHGYMTRGDVNKDALTLAAVNSGMNDILSMLTTCKSH